MNELNTDSKNIQNQSDYYINNNYISTIKTYIEYSSSNFQVNKKLYDLESFFAGKLIIQDYNNMVMTLDKIQAIFFDKLILSLLEKQKMSYKDYNYLFYVFFLEYNFRKYIIDFNHTNFSKFFKKFFNSCMKSQILKEEEIYAFIDFYQILLYQLITNSPKEMDISVLKKKPIINLEKFDNIRKKYMKFLIKYILAFSNSLESTKKFKEFHLSIFDSFLKIEDPFFYNYYMKQLNKIFLNKGIYSFSNNFVQNILYPLFYKSNAKSIHEFSMFSSRFINCILHYQPKYIQKENIKISIYKEGSPFYFLNISILIKLMREMTSNDNLIQNLLFKFTDMFNNKINLFINDNSKLRVAEYLLIDSTNNNLIKKHLDIIEIIKPFFKREENNKNSENEKNDSYFESLFYDLCIENYINFYFNNLCGKKKDINTNINDSNLNDSIFSQSQDLEDYFSDNNNNISRKKTKKDYIDLMINKFNNSNHFFINKYFHKLNENSNNNKNELISKRSLEELFILLDIIYSISKKTDEKGILQECILDINKIIIGIITKSFNENKFNCTIFNFINNIDKKYLPPPSEFDIMKCNEILLNKSREDFIRTYPLYFIFILNYYPKYNLEISNFFYFLKSFMIGYFRNVFDKIDEDMNNYNHTLQINYLSIIYFIIEQILDINIAINKKSNDNNNINQNINKEVIQYLPYCLNCQKKQKNPFILSNYLSQCINCGEKHLFINTNLYDYLKNNRDKIKVFIDECIFTVITGITCNILNKFMRKYEKRDINSMFCYNLYYKIMNEHFYFLNYIKLKIGKKVPFVIDSNCEINNREGALEEYIKTFFDKYITDMKKYPFRNIYDSIVKDEFASFNSFRKTIKHEYELSKYKYFN